MNGFKPRCWARRAGDGVLCLMPSGHRQGDMHEDLGAAADNAVWWDDECAPNAGPDGRETAALRLWEISTQADLIAFRSGQRGVWAPLLRTIASRLLSGTDAVKEDYVALHAEIAQGERLLGEHPTDTDPRTKLGYIRWVAELLTRAAEVLRPFVESGR